MELDESATVASCTILECGTTGWEDACIKRFALGEDNGSTGEEVGEVEGVMVLDVRMEVRLVDEDEVDASEAGDSTRVWRGDALMRVLDPE